MLDLTLNQINAGLVALAALVFAVLFHYEGFNLFGRWLGHGLLPPRARIVLLMFGLLMLHIIEIWVFAGSYYLLADWPSYGALFQTEYAGAAEIPPMHWFDYVYYSATVYTTVGFGDIVPLGPIRVISGTESVCGLALITWSASFTFLEMQRYWGRD